MKRILVTASFLTLLALVLSPWRAPETSLAQGPPGADATITVQDGGECKIDIEQIQCANANCRRGAPINWKVVNQYAQEATVVLLNFRINAGGADWYLDPLRQVGQEGNRAEHFVNVGPNGGEATIRTLVREIENDFFRGTYNYDIAIRFNNAGNFALCPDPMLDIDG